MSLSHVMFKAVEAASVCNQFPHMYKSIRGISVWLLSVVLPCKQFALVKKKKKTKKEKKKKRAAAEKIS